MAENDQEKVNQATTIIVAVMKREVEMLYDRLDTVDRNVAEVLNKLSDGLLTKITIMEQKIAGYDSVKKWITGLLAVLIAAMIVGFIVNNNAAQKQAGQLEQQLHLLEQQFRQKSPAPPLP